MDKPAVTPSPGKDSDALCFADERDPLQFPRLPKWKLLIVDDEEEVHVITRMVLEGLTFSGRSLSFHSVYSGLDGREFLRDNPDTAVVLLDVVMETNQAGLNLVEFIRQDLQNSLVRIILRTGQPGQAPEREVITRYDINDYKHKTELTAQKLFSAVTTAIRSYHDLKTIEKSRKGLSQIIASTGNLFQSSELPQFASCVLDQMVSLLQVNEDCLFLHSPSGFAATIAARDVVIVAGTGEFEDCGIERDVCHLEPDVTAMLEQALVQQCSVYAPTAFIQYFRSGRGSENLLYFRLRRGLNVLERRLMEVFAANVSIAFDNMQLNADLVRVQKEIIFTLGGCVESRSKETANHVRRVSECASLLARLAGMDAADVELLRLASPMHDVGKIAIPDAILLKPGPLTPVEFDLMKTHTRIGYHIFKGSQRPVLRAAAVIAHEHHERWDGGGYPCGLQGTAIHPFGRVVALIDVFDSLLSKRVYKDAWDVATVLDYLRKERGGQFEPELVDIVLDHCDAFLNLRQCFAD